MRLPLIVLLSISAISPAIPQDNAPGQPMSVQCKFPDGNEAKVTYLSAKLAGRRIFGAAVPYGRVWETGTGKPTTLSTSTNLIIGGKNVPAGTYTIFTIPETSKWTLIVNKRTTDLGMPYGYESTELTRIDLMVRTLASPLEEFSIEFDQRRGGCVLNFRWENTEASALVAETK